MKLPIEYSKTSIEGRRKVREEYIRLQGGRCYFCKEYLSMPPTKERPINAKLFPVNFFKWPIHLHHSHKTDLTIGAVHAYCNAVLWQYYGE